jgi:MarR family 2-MHQ and catechol resistance regulon transcriptional repressor
MPSSYFDDVRARHEPSDVSALRVFLALRAGARRVDHAVNGWLQRSDLNVTKFDVLQLLSLHPAGETIGRLREQLRMTQPNVTLVVQSLERDGFLERLSDPADRRSTIARITPAGVAIVERLTPSHLAAIGSAIAQIPERDRERLIEMLATIAESFEAVEDSP